MLAKKTLNTDVRPLTSQDSISAALGLMEEMDANSLPVIDSTTQKLIGQVSFKKLQGHTDHARSISDIELDSAVKIYEAQHIFEAARLMLLYEMRFIPVVNNELEYRGTVRKQNVLEVLTDMLNLGAYGSVITIELDERDFSLSEIVHLIEMEGAKILGITVETPDANNRQFEVSVKLNLQDVSRVAATLRRYSYTISAEPGTEVLEMDLEHRADELIKYLDM